MIQHLFVTGLGAITVLLSTCLALFAYDRFRRGAIRLWEREQRLPDATRFSHLQNRIADLEEELGQLQDARLDAMQTIDEASRLRDWMEQTKEEVANLHLLKEEVIRVSNELESNQVELGQLVETLAGLREDVSKAQEAARSLQRVEQELEQSKTKLNKLEQATSTLREELKGARADRESILETIAKSERELSRMKEEQDQIREAVTKLSGEKDDLVELIGALEEEEQKLELRVEQLTEQEKKLQASVAKLRSEEDQLNTSVKELRRKSETAEDNLEKLRRAESNLKQENSELKQRLEKWREDVSEKQRELAKLRDAERDLKKQLSSLDGRIAGLTAQREGLEKLTSALGQVSGVGDASQGAETAKAIWTPIFNRRRAAEPMEELTAIDALRSYLRECHLQYSQRVLDSFHTSLKVADSTPLVVLAGVSGTGKSELPRRYAEAIGMNFLNVAVQPRWDSPQDLFGFYDYIDRRFRPTDLTRALIQMDTLGPSRDRGWSPTKNWEQNRLHQQMLLVLLDEMNLARVEYYFSEFLSRLETRRSLTKTPSQRELRNVEITLDVGMRGENSTMRLFPGSNVIFVGTMNEDETTQTLSDKVIDRANVLRFGSPSRLEIPQQPNGEKQKTGELAIQYSSWLQWQRTATDLTSSERENLDEWIEKLRQAMKTAQRPFAYRVAIGMLDYAANYPRREDWLRHAMADQIEHKILPKLRGLNPQDGRTGQAFDMLHEVMRELDDEALVNEFESCCEESFFQWTGIDREDIEVRA